MTRLEESPNAAQSPTAGRQAATAARGVLGLVASAVRLITGLFAAVLALNIVLILLGANPFNAVARFVVAVANALTLGLANLFLMSSPTWQVIFSYGVPAIAWLIIGSIIVAVLRSVARPKSGLA